MIQRLYKRDNSKNITLAAACDILKFPHVTEKSSILAQNKRITLIVDIDANKCDIKKACEILFKTEVKSVNTSIKKQKLRGFKGKIARRSPFKKAIISFKNQEDIENILGGIK